MLTEFRSYCGEAGLSLSVINKPGELGRLVRQYSPYLVLVVGWHWLIKPSVLKAVPGGFVGIHASLLPQYRGNAPLVWALLRGEEQTGVSLFHFDEGMDTGDIIDQISFSIAFVESIADVLEKAEKATVDLVTKYAEELRSGTAPCRKQTDELATFVSQTRPEDGHINWSQSAQELHNFIRAQTRPYPGAFTYLPNGKTLRIWRAPSFLIHILASQA
jgi:methionyl-tRNA formyltransferase